MDRLLIAYGTGEGQTRKIATFMAAKARELGVQACLDDAAEELDFGVEGFDAVILAGSLHAGAHQAELLDFARRHRSELSGRHTAFVSVSLSAAGGAADRANAMAAAQAFLRRAEWRPDQIHLAAGAFRYTRYGFLKRWVMRRIARSKGAPTDTSRDWELTDWADVAQFLRGFLTRTAPAAPADKTPFSRPAAGHIHMHLG